jgi:hypothetical protein
VVTDGLHNDNKHNDDETIVHKERNEEIGIDIDTDNNVVISKLEEGLGNNDGAKLTEIVITTEKGGKRVRSSSSEAKVKNKSRPSLLCFRSKSHKTKHE